MDQTQIVFTRPEAAALGMTFYTGRPCPRCGEAIRYTSSAQCVRCTKRRAAKRTDDIRRTLREAKGG